MKKTYIQPAITIVKTDTECPIMAGSQATSLSGNGTTETMDVRRDPTFDDWYDEE